jgi:N-acetylmuramoyl-L-alanine amidase
LLRTGSLLADWDGLELRLGFAPMQLDHRPCIHARDLEKTVLPLFQPSGFDAGATIIIDPGHGGTDSGARSVLGGGCEKDYTLDWALRVRQLLEAQGRRVLLTRTSDKELSPTNRVAYATAQRGTLFVSLHFNSAAPDHSEAGLETYCLTPQGMPSSLTRGYADETAQAFPNNTHDSANLALAIRVHRSLLRRLGPQDRGVRRARFPAVLRGQQCPAVLVEGGYLSNAHEARLIADPAHRQKLAEALAAALQPGTMDR